MELCTLFTKKLYPPTHVNDVIGIVVVNMRCLRTSCFTTTKSTKIFTRQWVQRSTAQYFYTQYF